MPSGGACITRQRNLVECDQRHTTADACLHKEQVGLGTNGGEGAYATGREEPSTLLLKRERSHGACPAVGLQNEEERRANARPERDKDALSWVEVEQRDPGY